MTDALKAGYRHIDSARIYRNEVEVIKAVKDWQSQGNGESVWITSKVYAKEHGTVKTDVAVTESIERAKALGFKWVSFYAEKKVNNKFRLFTFTHYFTPFHDLLYTSRIPSTFHYNLYI